jgi:hypothetical protein
MKTWSGDCTLASATRSTALDSTDRVHKNNRLIIDLLKNLVTKCWERDPNIRPDINNVCNEIRMFVELYLCSPAQNTYAVIEVQDTGEYNDIAFPQNLSETGTEEKPDRLEP